jgi:hypothetical protein
MARNPFKVGDYVVADDPFNGRAEGVVVEVSRISVGVRPVDRPQERHVYYDYRTVQPSY